MQDTYHNEWADRDDIVPVTYGNVDSLNDVPDEEDDGTTDTVSRMRARLDQSDAFTRLDEIVLKYAIENGNRWSFKGHEFQRQIIRDTSARIAVKKCSQVGLSSTIIQKTLAMLSVLPHEKIIYTMPTSGDAFKFSKDRFDPAIENSPYYAGMMKQGKNSASMKQLGTSTLYLGGTNGGSAGISVPALAVINDELDFSDQRVVSQLASRLRHQKEDVNGDKGFRFRFSTPTVEEFGIDLAFQEGSQYYYLVKCKHCNSWHQVDYFRDMFIPGFDNEIDKLSLQDFKNPKNKISEAMIRCPGCRNELQSSLIDPTRRAWAAKHPERTHASYQVFPWDVPTINTPASIIRQFQDYGRYEEEFYNFTIGVARTTADNSFLTNEMHRRATQESCLYAPDSGPELRPGQTVMGVDVGKICHVIVLEKAETGYRVIYAERVSNTITEPAKPRIMDMFKFYGCGRLCVDAGPDITLSNSLVNDGKGKIAAVEYASRVEGLDSAKVKDEGRVIRADRNKTMAFTMKEHNAGRIRYAKQVQDEIFEHLKTIKRIVNTNAGSFDEVERFDSNGNDHYGHALNYAMIAADDDITLQAPGKEVVGHRPMVGGVKMSGKARAQEGPRQQSELQIMRNLYGRKY